MAIDPAASATGRARMTVTVRVRLTRAVSSDTPYLAKQIVAPPGEHEAEVGACGSLHIQVDGGLLGIKPGEFEFVDYPELKWPDVPWLFAEVERLRRALASATGAMGLCAAAAVDIGEVGRRSRDAMIEAIRGLEEELRAATAKATQETPDLSPCRKCGRPEDWHPWEHIRSGDHCATFEATATAVNRDSGDAAPTSAAVAPVGQAVGVLSGADGSPADLASVLREAAHHLAVHSSEYRHVSPVDLPKRCMEAANGLEAAVVRLSIGPSSCQNPDCQMVVDTTGSFCSRSCEMNLARERGGAT